MAEPVRDYPDDAHEETTGLAQRASVVTSAVTTAAPGDNAVRSLQAFAETVIAEEAQAAARWSPRASFATIAGASAGLWALIGLPLS